MISASLTPTPESEQALQQAIAQLSRNDWIEEALRDLNPFIAVTRENYDVVRRLPGGGPDGFAYRTGALYKDVTQAWVQDGLTITGGSDQSYAGQVEGRVNDRGMSLFAPDDEYFTIVEQSIGDKAEQVWAES